MKLLSRRQRPAAVRSVVPDRRSADDKLLDWLATLPVGEAQAIRQDSGWTLAQVAERCRLSQPQQVGRWERDGRGWSRRSGVLYARLLRELEGESE